MSRIISALSKLLEPAERECVCGDLEELRLGVPAAAANILGLFIRRQVSNWSKWTPWIALIGIASLGGIYLSRELALVQTGLFVQIRTYLKYGVAYQPGGVSVSQNIAYTATLLLAVLLFTWACGFVLASLSGRALWITWFLFYFVVQYSWLVRMALAGKIILNHWLGVTMLLRLLPLSPVMIVFLVVLAVGIRSGTRGSLPRTARLLLGAVGLTSIALLVWMQEWFVAGFAQWSGQSYVAAPFLYRVAPLLTYAWPVLALPFLANKLHSGSTREERLAR